MKVLSMSAMPYPRSLFTHAARTAPRLRRYYLVLF